jgi:hypothetical protein
MDARSPNRVHSSAHANPMPGLSQRVRVLAHEHAARGYLVVAPSLFGWRPMCPVLVHLPCKGLLMTQESMDAFVAVQRDHFPAYGTVSPGQKLRWFKSSGTMPFIGLITPAADSTIQWHRKRPS